MVGALVTHALGPHSLPRFQVDERSVSAAAIGPAPHGASGDGNTQGAYIVLMMPDRGGGGMLVLAPAEQGTGTRIGRRKT